MKTYGLIVVLLISATITQAQNTVTIHVNGTRTQEIYLDGELYRIENYGSTSNRAPIVVPNVKPGQHTLKLVRSRGTTGNTVATTKNFNVRQGYDLELSIAANGAVSTKETRQKRWNNASDNADEDAMSDSEFRELYRDVQSVSRQATRISILNDAFHNQSNFFTSSQARQLILLVSAENSRLELAKLAYHTLVDYQNSEQLYDLFRSQANKNEFASYIRLNAYNDGMQTHNQHKQPLSEEEFASIYRYAQSQWQSSLRLNYITDFFADPDHFFTSDQAKQLIQLISGEAQRLTLAKTSYRGITDAENFTRVYDVFSSQKSREQLTAYVNNYNGNLATDSNYKTPMNDSEFNRLYRSIQNTWGADNKYKSLKSVFAGTSYWFTTAQAKQLIQLISNENYRLELAKQSYDNITDPVNFNDMYSILSSEYNRDELARHVKSMGGTDLVDIYRSAMTDAEFEKLYSQVQNTWGFGAKMSSLSQIFANNNYWFSSDQASKLIRLVSSESNRVELAKAAYDNVTDPANFSLVYETIASQSGKNELDAYVKSRDRGYNNNNNNNTGSVYRTPMTDTEFNSLYRGVQNTWGFGAKMNSLTNIFANGSYWFTTAQAKRLIQLVSSESNRLQLAKAAYDNITDPQNYSQVNEVLESQQSRDELSAYINSYSYSRY